MIDPDVTLTDYGLALLCGVLAWRLWRGPHFGPARRWLILFFASAGLAPLLGGTVHGFFPIEGTPEHDILWAATLLAVGLTGLAAWGLGARWTLRDGLARGLIGLAMLAALGYAAAVLEGSREFRVAVIFYLPAVGFLLLALFLGWRRAPGPDLAVAAAGLLLTVAAAGIQQMGIDLHPSFDHNALYHVVQAAALLLFYRGAVSWSRRAPPHLARAGRTSGRRGRRDR